MGKRKVAYPMTVIMSARPRASVARATSSAKPVFSLSVFVNTPVEKKGMKPPPYNAPNNVEGTQLMDGLFPAQGVHTQNRLF